MAPPVKLLSLTLEHFMPFRERVGVPLCDVGLVHVRGRNEVSAAADSNGAGKSSLIVDGPAWVLFGETLRGLKAEAVACRLTKEPAVGVVRVLVGDEEVVVRRQARPTKLEVSNQSSDLGVKELQSVVNSMLGWGLRTYRNAVVFGQGAFERFAQAEQADQLRMLDEIQGLDFRAARDRAKAWWDDADFRAVELDAKQARLDERIADFTAQLEELERQRAEFERDKQRRVREAARGVEAAQDELDRRKRLVKDAEKLVADVAAVRVELPRLRAEAVVYGEAERVVAAAQSALRVAQKGVDAAVIALDRRKREVEDLLARGACPTCRVSKFDVKTSKRVRAAFAAELEGADLAVSRAGQDLLVTKRALADAESALAARPKRTPVEVGQWEERGSDRALARAKSAIEVAVREQSAAAAALARASEARDAVRDERYAGDALMGGLRRDRGAAAVECDALAPDIQRARTTAAVAEYWLEAFGDRGIRSLLFDGVAGFLNERLEHHLRQLAAGEVDVQVSALSALKGGGSRERISVTSEWRWGGAGRGAGSAGQDRRVDLALFAALQDLAESRSARPFPFRIWDEPGDALDATGQELFAQWVEAESARRGAGFLVTHSQSLAESVRAAQTWTVVMRKSGAVVECGPGLEMVDVTGRSR